MSIRISEPQLSQHRQAPSVPVAGSIVVVARARVFAPCVRAPQSACISCLLREPSRVSRAAQPLAPSPFVPDSPLGASPFVPDSPLGASPLVPAPSSAPTPSHVLARVSCRAIFGVQARLQGRRGGRGIRCGVRLCRRPQGGVVWLRGGLRAAGNGNCCGVQGYLATSLGSL